MRALMERDRGSGHGGRPVVRGAAAGVLTLVAGVAVMLAMSVPAGAAAAPAPLVSATPVIIDTDLYSNTDDVGALALAFSLQNAGEANVLAITLNRPNNNNANPPLSRAYVALHSFQCAAAIGKALVRRSTPCAEIEDTMRVRNRTAQKPILCAGERQAVRACDMNGIGIDRNRQVIGVRPDDNPLNAG